MNRTVVVVAASLVAACGIAQGQILIDGFDDTQTALANAGLPGDNTVVLGSMIGGDRQFYTFWDSGPGNVELTANASGSSQLNFSLGPDTYGSGVVLWQPVGVDLTDGGTLTGVSIDVGFDNHPATLYIEFQSGHPGYGNSTGTLNLPGGMSAPQSFFLPFSSMTGNADFTVIDSILLSIYSQSPTIDLRIDSVAVTPSPASLALLGAGGLFVGRRRR